MLADSLVVIGLATLSLGTIQEADGPREHTFWLRNAGTEATTLRQGYTSCGCTTIQFDREKTLCSGDSTSVVLRFNPRGKGGEFEETGTLVYGEHRKRVVVKLTGNCITSEETLLRQFPIRINDSLRLSADRFDLGVMTIGQTKERNVVVLHRDEADRQERLVVRFTADERLGRGLHHVAQPVQTADGRRLTITLDVLVK